MGNVCSPPRASDPKVGVDHITLLGGSLYQLASNSRSSVLSYRSSLVCSSLI